MMTASTVAMLVFASALALVTNAYEILLFLRPLKEALAVPLASLPLLEDL